MVTPFLHRSRQAWYRGYPLGRRRNLTIRVRNGDPRPRLLWFGAHPAGPHRTLRSMDDPDRDDAGQRRATAARDPGDVPRSRLHRHRDGRRPPRHRPGAAADGGAALPARAAAAHRPARRPGRDPHLAPPPRPLRPALAAPVPPRHPRLRARGRGPLTALARVQGHPRGDARRAAARRPAGGRRHGRQAPRDPPPAGGADPESRLRRLGVPHRVLRRRHGVLLRHRGRVAGAARPRAAAHRRHRAAHARVQAHEPAARGQGHGAAAAAPRRAHPLGHVPPAGDRPVPLRSGLPSARAVPLHGAGRGARARRAHRHAAAGRDALPGRRR